LGWQLFFRGMMAVQLVFFIDFSLALCPFLQPLLVRVISYHFVSVIFLVVAFLLFTQLSAFRLRE
jgi:hypothetical protein